MTYEMPA